VHLAGKNVYNMNEPTSKILTFALIPLSNMGSIAVLAVGWVYASKSRFTNLWKNFSGPPSSLMKACDNAWCFARVVIATLKNDEEFC